MKHIARLIHSFPDRAELSLLYVASHVRGHVTILGELSNGVLTFESN